MIVMSEDAPVPPLSAAAGSLVGAGGAATASVGVGARVGVIVGFSDGETGAVRG
jgi:hypothetical protein